MTDNEIIKCAENCTSDSPSCGICLYNDDRLTSSECMGELMKDLFDLTNRQQAEVERLHKAIKVQDIMIEQQDYKLKTAKSEAIKEFAERLKSEVAYCDAGEMIWFEKNFDNLVKEMTEVQK